MARTRWMFAILAVAVVLTHLHIHSLLREPIHLVSSPPPLEFLLAVKSSAPSPTLHPPPLPPSAEPLIMQESTAVESTPRAADIAACERASQSCLACVRIKPRKPPNDSGVRCVWCRDLRACQGYVKGTPFPCADAVRGGGGYPGGGHCAGPRNATTPAQTRSKWWRRSDQSLTTSSGPSAMLQVPPISLAGTAATTAPTTEMADAQWRTPPLRFTSPAGEFREALPLGNGRLGASVYGQPWRDKVGLNEESIVAGPRVSVEEVAQAMRQKAATARSMERLMAAGDVRGAEREAQTLTHGKVHSYEFLGALRMELAPSECAGAADDDDGLRCTHPPAAAAYRRELDLERAIASVSHLAGRDGCAFERQAFVSSADDIIAVRLNASCTFDAIFSLDRTDEKPASSGAMPKVAATALEETRRAVALHGTSSGNGVGFAVVLALASVEPSGSATVRRDHGRLTVRGATDVTLLLAAATDFDRRQAGEPPTAPAHLILRCRETLETVGHMDWAALRERHVSAHAARFGTFRLRLGHGDSHTPDRGTRSDLPTNERVRASRTAPLEDYGLVEQTVQLGRYLLLASSGPFARLPANLQGVWAEGARPPWGSDFHLNINLQQIYWPAGPLGLTETLAPLAPFLARLAKSGAHVATHMYNVHEPGAWMAHGFTDAWASAAPLAPPMWALCASCGGWAALQLWQRFEFSREVADLHAAWPLLRGSAAFFASALLRRGHNGNDDDDGQQTLRWGPSHSPENAFADGNGSSRYLSYDVALDLGVITHTARAAAAGAEALRTLGELSSDDESLVARLARLVPRLPHAGAPLVDDSGALAEWWGDGHTHVSADPGHRHFSHLYPLHPGDGIDTLAQPELGRAARRALEVRLRHGGGHTGWSAAWAVSLWARLLDGGLAHAALRYTLHEFTSPALLGLHPKLAGKGGGGPRCMTCVGRVGKAGEGIFQLDANSGISAGVAEMLLQSHGRTCHVHLLPALPPAWTDGAATGLRARGAWRVDVRWSKGRLTSARIAHAPPSTSDAKVVRSSTPLTVCCAPSVCGADDAALAAATKSTVRNSSGAWAWDVALKGDGEWTVTLQ